MILTEEQCKWRKYAEWYPCKLDPDYDGVHDGGLIRMKPDAPEWAKKDCEQYLKMQEECWN